MVKPIDQSVVNRSDGAATKKILVSAGLATVSDVGYAATTARKIAQRAGVNSALVFYHFGSVDDLLVAGLNSASERRLFRYEQAVTKTPNFTGFVKTLRRLWNQDNDSAEITAIRDLVADRSFSLNHEAEIGDALGPWVAFAERQVERILHNTPLAEIVDAKAVAFGLVSTAIGVDTLQQLVGGKQKVTSLFSSLQTIAELYDAMTNGESQS